MVRAQPAELGSALAVDPQKDVLLVACFPEPDIVEFVLLVVKRLECGGAQHVPPQLVGSLGDGVFGGQEERLVVGSLGDGLTGVRRSKACAAAINSIATTVHAFSMICRVLMAVVMPMETKSSWSAAAGRSEEH